MFKKIKLKNSTIMLCGIIIISLGVCACLYEYFIERKNRIFSNMNIMLYESEEPQNILSDSNDALNEEQQNNDTEEKEADSSASTITYNYLGVLEIPKINLKNGFYDLNYKYNNVDYNVTVINGSTYPGEQNNNLILAAHSGNCAYCYFDNLYKLQLGDVAYLQYKNQKYSYKIVDIYEVEKDGTVAIYRDYSKNCLTLITCTRGSDTKQTVYILEEN